jgi:ParB family chromosome partitioning protein
MASKTRTIGVGSIRPNPHQPRKSFPKDAIRALAGTIKTHGLLQPLVVRRRDGGKGFELIAGERRLRAIKLLGWQTVPVIVTQAGDQQAEEMAVVENLMREDLNPVEEGRAMQNLLDSGVPYRRLAVRLGKSVGYIQNRTRLLSMPSEVQALARDRPHMLMHCYELSRVRDNRLRQYLVGKCRGDSLGQMTLTRLRREMLYAAQEKHREDDDSPYALWRCEFIRNPEDGDEMYLGSCHPSIVEKCLRRISRNTLRRSRPPYTLWIPYAGSGTGIETAKRMGVRRVIATDVIPMARGIVKADARNSGIASESVDAIFAHPPYWHAIRYSRVYGRAKDVDDISLCRTLDDYLQAMDEFLAEAFRVLRPDGRLYVLIGDVRKKNLVVPLVAHLTLLGTRRFLLTNRITVLRNPSSPLTPILISNARRRDHLVDITETVLFFRKPQ